MRDDLLSCIVKYTRTCRRNVLHHLWFWKEVQQRFESFERKSRFCREHKIPRQSPDEQLGGEGPGKEHSIDTKCVQVFPREVSEFLWFGKNGCCCRAKTNPDTP